MSDFGQAKDLSEYLEGQSHTKGLGTPGYKAPEILEEVAYGKPADVWSLGCIIHLFCTKTRWFNQREDEILKEDYIQRIKTEKHAALPTDVYNY